MILMILFDHYSILKKAKKNLKSHKTIQGKALLKSKKPVHMRIIIQEKCFIY